LYRNFLFYPSPSPLPSPPFAGERGRVRGLNLINPKEFGADREEVRLALEAENIESRPI